MPSRVLTSKLRSLYVKVKFSNSPKLTSGHPKFPKLSLCSTCIRTGNRSLQHQVGFSRSKLPSAVIAASRVQSPRGPNRIPGQKQSDSQFHKTERLMLAIDVR